MAFFDKLKSKFGGRKEQDREQYLSGLSKTRKTFGDRIRALAGRKSGIDDEVLEEIMVILLESDVGFSTAQKIVDEVSERRRDLKDYDGLDDFLSDIIYDFYNPGKDGPMNLNPDGPTVIMMVGVNGSGKTTTSAKLSKLFGDMGQDVLLVAADTFRAGAIDQLDQWAQRLGTDIVKGKEKQDPASVMVDGCRKANEAGKQLVICDTAGRLQNKTNLMKELSKMSRVCDREIAGAPHETWLVLDATTGQNGISQAQQFMEATPVTGIILTKMDGTAKGGVVLAIRDQLGLPVRFLGLGEKPEDLRPFDMDSYLAGIMKGLDHD